MRAAALLPLLALACSCSALKLRIEQGYGEPVALGDALNSKIGSGKPLDAHFTRVGIGRELLKYGSLSAECFAGVFSAFPQEHESSPAIGLSLSPRIVRGSPAGLRQFLGAELGVGHADWEQQGSDLGFLVGHSAGVLYPISEKIDVSMSWQLFHWSNAGIEKPNPGLNSDMFVLGLEFKF